MAKKNHQILDSLIQNIEINVSGFIVDNQVKEYKQHVYKVSELTHDRLIDAMNSADSYTFDTIGDCPEIRCNVKAPFEVDEQEKKSLENIRIAQLQLVEKLKEAKNMQNSLYKMMKDFKQGDQ